MDYPIPLTQGKTAWINSDDVPIVAGYEWRATQTKTGSWYARTRIRVAGRTQDVYLHRLLMQPPDGLMVIFDDGDGLNCRRSNMIVGTPAMMTIHTDKPHKTRPYRGIYFDRGKWKARSYIGGKQHYLGRYDDPAVAAKAYDDFVFGIYGDVALCNFPREQP